MNNQEAIASLRTLCHNCKLFPKCAYEKSECFKAIEMAISALQAQDVPDINVGNMISREELFEELNCINLPVGNEAVDKIFSVIENMPSAQTERCEYYALCRHGRDENKLRSALGCCDYCNEDSDGYVKPIEKNSHAFIRFGMDGWELDLSAKGWHGSAKIRYCPMCGRDLLVK